MNNKDRCPNCGTGTLVKHEDNYEVCPDCKHKFITRVTYKTEDGQAVRHLGTTDDGRHAWQKDDGTIFRETQGNA